MTTPDNRPHLTLTVQLWPRDGNVEAFEAFERKAARVMGRHGGRIVRVERPDPSGNGPFEVHTITFPDESAFEAYRSDPETLALAAERERVIARTEVIQEGRG